MNYALLMSTNTGWARTSDLEALLVRLGFTVCHETAKALAEPQHLRLLLTCRSAGEFSVPSMPAGTSLPAETLRFAIAPHQAGVGVVVPGFHATLASPVDECAFVSALAACRYVASSVHERESLRTRIMELACGDEVVARHFIRLLIETNCSTLATLRDAFSTLSWDAAGHAAHLMAGSARMLDCRGLLAFLSRLEDAAYAHQVVLARSLLQVVANTIDGLDVSLQTLLDAASPL